MLPSSPRSGKTACGNVTWEIATIGATGRGGVNRQALTPEDGEARRRVLDWAS